MALPNKAGYCRFALILTMSRASENEIVSLGIYEDEKSLENAQEAVKELMSQMSGFLTSTLETITAEAIRSFKS